MVTRDRPAKNPGGMECQRCNCIFIGEEWHEFCAVCVQEVADELAAAQHSSPDSAAPFSCVIDHRGYAVRNGGGLILAICRRQEDACLIVGALNGAAPASTQPAAPTGGEEPDIDDEFTPEEQTIARAIVRLRELFERAPYLQGESQVPGCGIVTFGDLKVIQEYADQKFEAGAPSQSSAGSARPVARAHISLQDDGPYAELEVLDGAFLQPSMSPVDLYLAPAQGSVDVRKHIAWLFQYVQGMNERNWLDMKLRAERQLEQLSLAFPGPSVPSTEGK